MTPANPSPTRRPAALPLAFCALTAAFGTQATAQENPLMLPAFTMPRGCELIVIMQAPGCFASVIYSCEGDAQGTRRIADMVAEGMTYHSSVDAVYTWIDGFDPATGEYFETEMPVADTIDVDALVANGVNSFAITQVNRANGERQHFRGYDWLTGNETTIDGVRLLEAEFRMAATFDDGSPYFSAEGTEWVEPDLGLFFTGDVWYDGDASEVYENTPIEFVFPGEPGDTAYQPRYGCN